jgi:hypothetical protein
MIGVLWNFLQESRLLALTREVGTHLIPQLCQLLGIHLHLDCQLLEVLTKLCEASLEIAVAVLVHFIDVKHSEISQPLQFSVLLWQHQLVSFTLVVNDFLGNFLGLFCGQIPFCDIVQVVNFLLFFV